MATKDEHIAAMKSANSELFKNVNGTRIKLTDSEYDAQIDEWATNAAADDVRTNIKDNPRLTCRIDGLSNRSPARIIFDNKIDRIIRKK